eukprot:jgi/Botrbrau1/16646/Bobra.0068s0063.1
MRLLGPTLQCAKQTLVRCALHFLTRSTGWPCSRLRQLLTPDSTGQCATMTRGHQRHQDGADFNESLLDKAFLQSTPRSNDDERC